MTNTRRTCSRNEKKVCVSEQYNLYEKVVIN